MKAHKLFWTVGMFAVLASGAIARAETPAFVDFDNLPEDQKKVLANPEVKQLVQNLVRKYGPLQEVVLGDAIEPPHPSANVSKADRSGMLHFIGFQYYDQVCMLKVTLSNDLDQLYAFEAYASGLAKGKPRVICED